MAWLEPLGMGQYAALLAEEDLDETLLRSMRPDELAFYHRALVAAREEMRLALRCFGADERDAAVALARRAAGGAADDEPDERAIGQAIAALEAAGPSAAFTRTGVQAGLDEEVLLRNRRRSAEPVVDDT